MTILPSLTAKNLISRSASVFLCDLLHGIGSVADPSFASPKLRDVVNYLKVEGIIVRIDVGSSTEVLLAAPLLRVVLLSYFNVIDQSRTPHWLQLPMKNDSSRQLDLLSCSAITAIYG